MGAESNCSTEGLSRTRRRTSSFRFTFRQGSAGIGGAFESYILNHDFFVFARFYAVDFNLEGEILGYAWPGTFTPGTWGLRMDDPDAPPRSPTYAFSDSRSINDRGVVTIGKNSSNRNPGSYPLIILPDGRVVNLEVATTGIFPFAPLSSVSLSMALNNHNQVVIGRTLPHNMDVGSADDPNVPYPTWYWEDGEGVFRLELEGHPGMIRTMTAHADSGEFLAMLVSPDGSEASPAIFTPVGD